MRFQLRSDHCMLNRDRIGRKLHFWGEEDGFVSGCHNIHEELTPAMRLQDFETVSTEKSTKHKCVNDNRHKITRYLVTYVHLLMAEETRVWGELEDPELQAEALETIPKENRIKIQDTKTDIFVTRIIQT